MLVSCTSTFDFCIFVTHVIWNALDFVLSFLYFLNIFSVCLVKLSVGGISFVRSFLLCKYLMYFYARITSFVGGFFLGRSLISFILLVRGNSFVRRFFFCKIKMSCLKWLTCALLAKGLGSVRAIREGYVCSWRTKVRHEHLTEESQKSVSWRFRKWSIEYKQGQEEQNLWRFKGVRDQNQNWEGSWSDKIQARVQCYEER